MEFINKYSDELEGFDVIENDNIESLDPSERIWIKYIDRRGRYNSGGFLVSTDRFWVTLATMQNTYFKVDKNNTLFFIRVRFLEKMYS